MTNLAGSVSNELCDCHCSQRPFSWNYGTYDGIWSTDPNPATVSTKIFVFPARWSSSVVPTEFADMPILNSFGSPRPTTTTLNLPFVRNDEDIWTDIHCDG